MAEFRLALGGTIDVATPTEVNDAITGLQGHIDQRLTSLKSDRWIWRNVQGSATLTIASKATAQIVLVPGRPAMGRVWSLRRITILGADDNTTVTGVTASVYAGDAANFNLAQCIVPGQVVPYFSTYGNNAIPIHDGETLFVNITAQSPITNQNFVVIASVMEWTDPSIEVQHA